MLGIYIIGFIVMLSYTVVEVKDVGDRVRFRDWILFLIGLLVWPIILGMLLYEGKRSLNELIKRSEKYYKEEK